jgi:hypothetical protein
MSVNVIDVKSLQDLAFNAHTLSIFELRQTHTHVGFNDACKYHQCEKLVGFRF